MAPRIARELRHPDAGRRAARLRRRARSAAAARSRRRRERPRCGVRGRALQAAHARRVRAYRHRSIAFVDAQTAPIRAARRANCAPPSRRGRHHSRTRRGRQARDLPAAGLGGLARSGAVHRAPQAKSRDRAGHRHAELPGEALQRAQVARSRVSSMRAVPEEPYIGRWWHRLGDGRLQCDLCPRDCRLHEGQRGACFVRMREHDRMVLTTYGRSSGFCIDPVEKKPLNHFYPGTSILSFGTAGCNLACKFCQNWDISKSREMDRLQDQASPEKIADAALELGCKSVAFTYNDPVIFAEYAMDIADACHAKGVKAVAVTAGYIHAEPRREFYAKMDAANVDLKGFTDEFYFKICGGRLQPVLDTLVYLVKETQVWTEITTLLIPGKNDSDEEIRAECKWIRENLGPDVPLHFTAFHPDWKMTDIAATPAATLTRAREIGQLAGLNYVYTGNVHDEAGGSTYCPSCEKALIRRDWYDIRGYHVTESGACGH